MFTLSIIFALCLKLSAGLKNDGDKEVEEPHLLDIIKNTASDVHNTIQHSKQPLKDLQECLFFVYFLFIMAWPVPYRSINVLSQVKYTPSLAKFGGGTLVGYFAAYVVKTLTLSVVKVVFLGQGNPAD